MTTSRKALGAGVAIALALALSGCGADDLELNGKIFDAMGVSAKTSTKGKEPKMVARAPLVVPPGLERLPEPGAQSAQASEIASLNDPDKVAEVNQAELERQQKEYCKVHYEYAKMHGDNEADNATGPLGPCRGSLLSGVKKLTNFTSSEGEGQDGQVEK